MKERTYELTKFGSEFYYSLLTLGLPDLAWEFAGIQVKAEKRLYKDILTHEHVCKCGHKVTDFGELEFFLDNGYCLSCDHAMSDCDRTSEDYGERGEINE